MTWELFLSIVAVIFSVFAVYLGYLFNKRIEDYRQSQIQRQKAELVAKLFAKWLKYRGNESNVLKPRERVEYYEDLTRLSFELSLWLKDEDLLIEIMKKMQTQSKSKEIWELLALTRNYLLDTESKFQPEEVITFWPTQEAAKDMFKKSDWQ